ncbi:hypothetical protein BC827DRAFT_104949 [Russula dissimulans]|nr:hypothetical protein BC827DRAFT_104949 [Russula dissimulans]
MLNVAASVRNLQAKLGLSLLNQGWIGFGAFNVILLNPHTRDAYSPTFSHYSRPLPYSLSAPRAFSRWTLVEEDARLREKAKYRATEHDGEYGSRWNSWRLRPRWCYCRTALVKCEW